MTNSKNNFLTLDQVIDNAIQNETQAASFYHKMQSIVTKSEVVGLLQILEKEEMQHLETLNQYKKNYKCIKSYIQFTPDVSLTLPSSEACKELGIGDMLNKAIEIEEKSAAYYLNLSNILTGEAKELFEGLAKFEESHIYKLKHFLLY